ncbi:helix-turn-helix domain-containing protein [Terasakiella pusilla]|uniref:helix-turn-helix domain-containing protein n=1 Tax=Terasakiella pusilla TaxID=64973 RepID=UPI003AA975C6
MLTPFGKIARKIRSAKGLRLLDVASELGVTSAFLSAVETGKKVLPQGFEEKVATAMSLAKDEISELRSAADQTRQDVKVSNLEPEDRELVAIFARRFNELPQEEVEDLKKRLFKEYKMSSSAFPFERRRGALVKPRSVKQIWKASETVRTVFANPDETAFPITEVLEFKLDKFDPDFCLDVCSVEDMGEDEGMAVPGLNLIRIREDVYEKAWDGDGRSRFTLAHELGHYLLHADIGLARSENSHDHPIYRDSEWQADTFAGGLLLPSEVLNKCRDADEAAEKCQTTYYAAEVMWDKYVDKGLL